MLSPYWFVKSIEEHEQRHSRREMAALALNLYYGESAMAFDLSRIVELCNFDRVACLAAVAWVSAHSSCFGGRQFPAPDREFLGERTYKRLRSMARVRASAASKGKATSRQIA